MKRQKNILDLKPLALKWRQIAGEPAGAGVDETLKKISLFVAVGLMRLP
jgi:hypothetical protein